MLGATGCGINTLGSGGVVGAGITSGTDVIAGTAGNAGGGAGLI